MRSEDEITTIMIKNTNTKFVWYFLGSLMRTTLAQVLTELDVLTLQVRCDFFLPLSFFFPFHSFFQSTFSFWTERALCDVYFIEAIIRRTFLDYSRCLGLYRIYLYICKWATFFWVIVLVVDKFKATLCVTVQNWRCVDSFRSMLRRAIFLTHYGV